MARPRFDHPTPAELEVLQVLWEAGPSTVRQVLAAMQPHRPRAYTTVMTLMNVMTDKQLVVRRLEGKAFVYLPKVRREQVLSQMVRDLVGRAFDGSASALVVHLLHKASSDELEQIRQTIENYERRMRGR